MPELTKLTDEEIDQYMKRLRDPNAPCGKCNHPKWMHEGMDDRANWCNGVGCNCLDFERRPENA